MLNLFYLQFNLDGFVLKIGFQRLKIPSKLKGKGNWENAMISPSTFDPVPPMQKKSFENVQKNTNCH